MPGGRFGNACKIMPNFSIGKVSWTDMGGLMREKADVTALTALSEACAGVADVQRMELSITRAASMEEVQFQSKWIHHRRKRPVCVSFLCILGDH